MSLHVSRLRDQLQPARQETIGGHTDALKGCALSIWFSYDIGCVVLTIAIEGAVSIAAPNQKLGFNERPQVRGPTAIKQQ
jgi:hypothetical protein